MVNPLGYMKAGVLDRNRPMESGISSVLHEDNRSFGISMASNMGFGVVKEFLPDIGRAISNKRAKSLALGLRNRELSSSNCVFGY